LSETKFISDLQPFVLIYFFYSQKMKLSIKNLNNQISYVDVAPNSTILQVKQAIQREQGHAVDQQKLIFAGKILEDNQDLTSCGVKETDFLVLMVRKPKTEGPPASQTTQPSQPAQQTFVQQPTQATQPAQQTFVQQPSSPQPAQQSSQPSQPSVQQPKTAQPSSPQPAQPAQQPSQPSQPAQPAQQSSFSALATGSEYEQSVANLCEMGFPRDQVIRALRAAFNNPDRAYEYLLTGIPEISDAPRQPPPSMQQPSAQPSQPSMQQPSSQQPKPTQPSSPQPSMQQPSQSAQPRTNPPASNTQPFPNLFGGPSAQGGGSGVFDFLKNHPQFNALRAMVQQNPQLLQPVLAQLAQQNPQLIQLINQHQQEFIQLLNEPVTESQHSGMPGPGGVPGPTPQYVQVTAEEKAAIDRLCSLGFDRQAVIEAYFACDKDENLAANYLFEHGAMGEEEDIDETNT
jgi:UV excision repair protein RAD23